MATPFNFLFSKAGVKKQGMGRQKKSDKERDNRVYSTYNYNVRKTEAMYGDSAILDMEYKDIGFSEEMNEEIGDISKEKEYKARRRIVNRPASQPYIKCINGENRLCFKYPTKMSTEEVKTEKSLEETEFSIKFDIDSVDIEKMTDKFKIENSIYPKANVDPEKYVGNRWEYETEVNKLAWKLTALNPSLLYGRKGIIQRAVDSFRNLHLSTSSRRVARMKKIDEGITRKRQPDNSPFSASVTWVQKGITKKCKIRVDIETIDYEKIDSDFRTKYSVFVEEFDDQSFGLGKWENISEDNILAVKIAFLNVDNTSFWNAVKATDKVTMLRKAVEVYKSRKSYEKDMTEKAEQNPAPANEEVYFADPSDTSYKNRSCYYYL